MQLPRVIHPPLLLAICLTIAGVFLYYVELKDSSRSKITQVLATNARRSRGGSGLMHSSMYNRRGSDSKNFAFGKQVHEHARMMFQRPPNSGGRGRFTTRSSLGRDRSSLQNIFTGIGINGKWSKISESYILRPEGTPKSFIFFLGGAFVGAAPQQWYRYILESLSAQGHVVVATPYQLDFDYLSTCRSIIAENNLVYSSLSQEYGVQPVIGMGHSCGSLLNVLLSTNLTEQESFERKANILVSFNNKPVKDAIPAFEQLVTPLALQLTGRSSSSQGPVLRSAIEEVQFFLRNAESLGKTGLLPPIYSNEILPFLQQGLSPLDQLPGLFEKIADGVSEFTPTTPEIQQGAKAGYGVLSTLLVKFEDDSIDETEIISSIFSEGEEKVPYVQKVLTGTHVTPCAQDVLFENPLDLLVPSRVAQFKDEFRENLLVEANGLSSEILNFINDELNEATAIKEEDDSDSIEKK
eukprot:jgi/Bigna1/88435/estExt_fgenesh1_pg.C_320022